MRANSQDAAIKPIARNAQARVLEALDHFRADAGAGEFAGGVAVVVDAGLLEAEQVVHLDLLAFHAGDLADAGDLALAAGETLGLDDQVNGAGDLVAEGAHGDVEA